jgi:N-carbamoyl-L-amino-acid hydrolase
VLLDRGLPLGVVTAIAGSSRYLVELDGVASHAGTTPMGMRRDAAAAAAEIVLLVERRCSDGSALVGTVGQLAVPGGSVNVIPGRCRLSLDIRSGDDAARLAACKTSWTASAPSARAAASVSARKSWSKPAPRPARRA